MAQQPPPTASPIDPQQYKIAKIWVIVSMCVSFTSILALLYGLPPIVPLLGLGLGIATCLGVYLPLTRGQYARAGWGGIIMGSILVGVNLVSLYNYTAPGPLVALVAHSGVLYAGLRARQWSQMG